MTGRRRILCVERRRPWPLSGFPTAATQTGIPWRLPSWLQSACPDCLSIAIVAAASLSPGAHGGNHWAPHARRLAGHCRPPRCQCSTQCESVPHQHLRASEYMTRAHPPKPGGAASRQAPRMLASYSRERKLMPLIPTPRTLIPSTYPACKMIRHMAWPPAVVNVSYYTYLSCALP